MLGIMAASTRLISVHENQITEYQITEEGSVRNGFSRGHRFGFHANI